MPPAWPDDSYLLLLGKVVYSIASLEGLLVFDLPRMPDTVDGLTPDALAGKTTTGIGKLLQNRAPGVSDELWRSYLACGGEALTDLGPKRNAELHLRPATVDGNQRLYRWRLEPPETLPTTTEHLELLLGEIEEHRQALMRLRPPFQK